MYNLTHQSSSSLHTGSPQHYHFSFDEVEDDRVVNDYDLDVVLEGSADHVKGKIGKALKLVGKRDFVDFGDQSDACLGNLELCQHGVTYSLWIQPDKLGEEMHFLSSGDNGVVLKYR